MKLSLSLSTLYSSCLKKGQWPCDWEKGDGAQVSRKDGKSVEENYRPVTVLTCKQSVRTLTGEPKIWSSSW